MRNVFLLIIIAVSFGGCKKDFPDHPYSKLNFPHNCTIRDIAVLDDLNWVVCGGDDRSGVVVRTTDKGQTWTTSTSVFEYPASCIHFINRDTGFAGDQDIIIYKTTNGGLNWNPFYDTSWPLSVNRNLRSIWFTNDSTGFICGGKNLGSGVLYDTQDGGNDWAFREFDHEYRGICFADEKNGVMVGHASILLTKDGGESFEMTGYDKEYFTGVCLDNLNNYWVIDLNGTILNSTDKGKTFKEKRNSSSWSMSGAQLNCIDISPGGRILCAGPNGFLCWSNNGGVNWDEKTSFGGKDILKLKWISESEAVAVGKNGGVFLISI